MQQLNLPKYNFKLKERSENDILIFDELRKKYIVLTPEEWVRQNFVKWLIREKEYPASLIAIEYEFKLNSLSKRCDVIVFSKKGNPIIIIEFKSPDIKINQEVFDQVLCYNMNFDIDYIAISNGLIHFLLKKNKKSDKYEQLTEFPFYRDL